MEKKEQQTTSPGGVTGEFHRLKENSTATVAELREFLGSMRGKRPQEALGVIAQSRLAKSIALSVIGFVVLLAAMTIIPYLVADEKPQTTSKKPGGDKPAAKAPAQPANTTTPTATAGTPTDGSSKTTVDPKAAAIKMGINELKNAPPDKNPLEDKLDDLLDGKK